MSGSNCDETICIMTGTLLSGLLKENLQPGNDREGFLLGKCTMQKIQVNSDALSNTAKMQEHIVISDFLSCDHIGEFYTGTGHLTSEKLSALLDEDLAPLVGWYRFRRHTPSRPSLRERIVHRELSEQRARPDGGSFLFLLMSEDLVDGVVQHDQKAFVAKENRLTAVRLEVANVGESAGAEYRGSPFSSLGLLLPSAARPEPAALAAQGAALAAQSAAHHQLAVLLDRVVRSERDTAAAWREVDELRRRLAGRGAGRDE